MKSSTNEFNLFKYFGSYETQYVVDDVSRAPTCESVTPPTKKKEGNIN